MEPYLMLHQNPYGQISRCSCCGEFRIAFGNIIVNLTENDFSSSMEFFTGLAQKYLPDMLLRAEKVLVIETAFPGFSLSVTVEELQWIADLLAQATIMMEVNRMLHQDF